MEGKTLNILLVEDDAIDVMNVKRAFQKNNIMSPLFVAGNGVEALELLRGGKLPAERLLVLLDLNMPKMNGIEFLRELRRDPALAPTPVVVLTTSNDDRDKVEAYNLNVAGYLLKPVTFVSFCETMATMNKPAPAPYAVETVDPTSRQTLLPRAGPTLKRQQSHRSGSR